MSAAHVINGSSHIGLRTKYQSGMDGTTVNYRDIPEDKINQAADILGVPSEQLLATLLKDTDVRQVATEDVQATSSFDEEQSPRLADPPALLQNQYVPYPTSSLGVSSETDPILDSVEETAFLDTSQLGLLPSHQWITNFDLGSGDAYPWNVNFASMTDLSHRPAAPEHATSPHPQTLMPSDAAQGGDEAEVEVTSDQQNHSGVYNTDADLSHPMRGLDFLSNFSLNSFVAQTVPNHDNSETQIADPESIPEAMDAEAALHGPCSNTWTLRKIRVRRKKLPETSNAKRKRIPDDYHGDQRRRSAFPNQQVRDETAWTRNNKSCIRCRIQHVRCYPDHDNPTGPCLTCQQISRPTIARIPCLRYIITDASLYREQNAPNPLFSKRWQNMDPVDITDWATPETRTIEITQVFLHAPYQVKVRKFIPAKGDMLEEKWTDGALVKTHQIPPYALANLGETAQMLQQFVDKNVATYIDGAVGHLDPLFSKTYFMAFKQIQDSPTLEERELLADTLRLWVACRKTSNPERICGPDQLGVPQITDHSSPWFTHVPMPPIIIAQMECIMYTMFLRPYRKKVLDKLQELVLRNKTKYWFTIYLTVFVLLHNCSMITRRNEEFARQMSMKTRFAIPSAIRAHHKGAQIILAHFHYVNKGHCPFSLASASSEVPKLANAAELTPSQVEFVRKTAATIQEKATVVRRAREEEAFGSDFYWVSQMYDDAWKPGSTA